MKFSMWLCINLAYIARANKCNYIFILTISNNVSEPLKKKKNNKITLFKTPPESQTSSLSASKIFQSSFFPCTFKMLNSESKYCTFPHT